MLASTANPTIPSASIQCSVLQSQWFSQPSFFSQADCARLIALITKESERDGGRTYCRNGGKRIEIPIRNLIQAFPHEIQFFLGIRSAILDRCLAFWQSLQTEGRSQSPLLIAFSLLSANNPGDSHVRHADNERKDAATHQWVPNHTPDRVLTALTYLNNCDLDFEGGELYFPRINTVIKPPQAYWSSPLVTGIGNIKSYR